MHCSILKQNVGDLVYNASARTQFQLAAVSLATPSVPVSRSATVTLPALSLAADTEQLSCAVARLLIAPSIHHAGDATTATTTALIDAVGHRQRRLVDRSASEPLSSASSSAVLESGAFCRYKTELCRPYEENGTCKYGEKCQFAHGRAELRPVVRHPKYKTDLCKTYHTTGLCPYGPRCHFIHNDDERHLNELNRIVIEQQRALLVQRQQKQVLVQAALALVRRRQLADAVATRVACSSVGAGRVSAASRSPSPSTLGDELLTTISPRADCGDEVSLATESIVASLVQALGRRVRQAAPQMTDAQVQAVVTRLLVGGVLSDPNTNVGYHYRRPHYIQLRHQQLQQQQQRTSHHPQSTQNSDERLLAL